MHDVKIPEDRLFQSKNQEISSKCCNEKATEKSGERISYKFYINPRQDNSRERVATESITARKGTSYECNCNV